VKIKTGKKYIFSFFPSPQDKKISYLAKGTNLLLINTKKPKKEKTYYKEQHMQT
jgi:hypothetical protein